MEPENITPDAVLGDAHVTSAGAEGAVGSESNGMTLDEINKHLGKTFPNKETALKALKDTFSYVGKKTEDIEKDVISRLQDNQKTDKLAQELEEMRKERFFDKNPQYAEPNTRKLIERLGGNPADVTESPEFKAIFEKAKGFDENQTLKTVLESNPRLASSRDSLTKAADLKASGANTDLVEAQVAAAIKDAYGFTN